jgi:prepilin-type N-terminal cleavage/methylation domain-containing protein
MKKFSSTSASNEAGFTLLEILIAIVLLAFITFGVVSITENAVNTKDRTTETNINNLQIETAMSRFEWDFSQSYSPLFFTSQMNLAGATSNQGMNDGSIPGQNTGGVVPPAIPLNPQVQQYYEQLIQRFERNEHFSAVSKDGQPIPRIYSPDKTTFEFFTTSNRRKLENQKQSHFAWVRYGLSEQTQTELEEQNPAIPKSLKSLVRYFSADDPYSDKRINIEDVDRVKPAVLLRNVESLEFQFWDLQRRKWDSNIRTIPQGQNIVRGVRILITWYDSIGSKRTASRIFRTHWPLVTPQDDPATVNPTGGATTGQTTGQVTSGITGGQ